MSKHEPVLECASGESGGALIRRTRAGVVGGQSPSPASGDGDGGARLETGLQGHPPTRGPAVWTGRPGSPRQQKLWVLSRETVRSPSRGSCRWLAEALALGIFTQQLQEQNSC